MILRLSLIVFIAAAAVFLAFGALPSWGHDLAAWNDPVRDEWYRSLRTPEKTGRNQISCCDMRDAAAINPDKVRQDAAGQWSVDLGNGYVPVPPDRVVTDSPSIDGLPYLFRMMDRTPDNPGGVRCFIPPIPTY